MRSRTECATSSCCSSESVPTIPEFIGKLDFPRHTYSMPYTEYSGRRNSKATERRKPTIWRIDRPPRGFGARPGDACLDCFPELSPKPSHKLPKLFISL